MSLCLFFFKKPVLEVTYITGLHIPVAPPQWLHRCKKDWVYGWAAASWLWGKGEFQWLASLLCHSGPVSPYSFVLLPPFLMTEILICRSISPSQPSLHIQCFSKDGIRVWETDVYAHWSVSEVTPLLTMEKEWWQAMLCPNWSTRKLSLQRKRLPACSPLYCRYLKGTWLE